MPEVNTFYAHISLGCCQPDYGCKQDCGRIFFGVYSSHISGYITNPLWYVSRSDGYNPNSSRYNHILLSIILIGWV